MICKFHISNFLPPPSFFKNIYLSHNFWFDPLSPFHRLHSPLRQLDMQDLLSCVKPPSVDKAWRANGECRQSSHSTIIQNEFSCPRGSGSSQLNSRHRCWYRQAAKPHNQTEPHRHPERLPSWSFLRSIYWGSWQGSWLVVKVRWRLLRDLPLPPNLPTWHAIAVVYGA